MNNTCKALLSLLFVTVGCLGCSDNGSNGPATLKGQLMISGLQGIRYKTATQEGVLDKDGTFDYLAGETLSFSIGNLPLAEDVPTHRYISFLEFDTDAREALDSGTISNGLHSHQESEEEVSQSDYTNNIARFVYLMGDTIESSIDSNSPVVISDRTIEQLNEYLATDYQPIDFYVPIETFEEEDSPANRLLNSICFFPPDAIECEVPPTQAEIDAAESAYDENGQLKPDLDRSIVYQEDLKAKREIIENGLRSTINLNAKNTTTALLLDALDIHKELATDLYFDTFTRSIREGDTRTQTIVIKSRNKAFTITEMEVVSLNENIVVIDQFDPAAKRFSFHGIGSVGQEVTLLINIKLANDYRWYQKTFRVFIE